MTQQFSQTTHNTWPCLDLARCLGCKSNRFVCSLKGTIPGSNLKNQFLAVRKYWRCCMLRCRMLDKPNWVILQIGLHTMDGIVWLMVWFVGLTSWFKTFVASIAELTDNDLEYVGERSEFVKMFSLINACDYDDSNTIVELLSALGRIVSNWFPLFLV